MKSCLSVGLFYNCQPVRIGLWFKRGHEFRSITGSKAQAWNLFRKLQHPVREVINEFNQTAHVYSPNLFSF